MSNRDQAAKINRAEKPVTRSSTSPAKVEAQSEFSAPVEAKQIFQQTQVDPQALHPHDLLRLQRSVGNRAVQRLLATQTIQARLTVGAAHDSYEEEADQVAEQVMRRPISPALTGNESRVQRATEEDEEELQAKPLANIITPLVQRAPHEVDEEELQTKRATAAGSFDTGADFENRLNATRGGGAPLPDTVRDFMEPRFGADFSGVRLHADGESAQLNREVSAQAFTLGSDIYLGEGQPDLTSNAGEQLLAHELTHTIQQGATQIRRRMDGNAAFQQQHPLKNGGQRAQARYPNRLPPNRVRPISFIQRTITGGSGGSDLWQDIQNLTVYKNRFKNPTTALAKKTKEILEDWNTNNKQDPNFTSASKVVTFATDEARKALSSPSVPSPVVPLTTPSSIPVPVLPISSAIIKPVIPTATMTPTKESKLKEGKKLIPKFYELGHLKSLKDAPKTSKHAENWSTLIAAQYYEMRRVAQGLLSSDYLSWKAEVRPYLADALQNAKVLDKPSAEPKDFESPVKHPQPLPSYPLPSSTGYPTDSSQIIVEPQAIAEDLNEMWEITRTYEKKSSVKEEGRHQVVIPRWGPLRADSSGTFVDAEFTANGVHAPGSSAATQQELPWLTGNLVKRKVPGGKNKTLYLKGHLLNDNLGGPSTPQNLIPLTGKEIYSGNMDSNAAHLAMLETPLKRAYQEIQDNGQKLRDHKELTNSAVVGIRYTVIAEYGNQNRNSESMEIGTAAQAYAKALGLASTGKPNTSFQSSTKTTAELAKFWDPTTYGKYADVEEAVEAVTGETEASTRLAGDTAKLMDENAKLWKTENDTVPHRLLGRIEVRLANKKTRVETPGEGGYVAVPNPLSKDPRQKYQE